MVVPEPVAGTAKRVLLADAVRRFIEEFASNAADNTVKKYRLLLAKLIEFSTDKGYVMVDQWTPTDVFDLRKSWQVIDKKTGRPRPVLPQTATKNMSTIKSFFAYCTANEWISQNPTRLVKQRRTRDAADSRNEQKLPFTDDELKRMYEACEHQYGKREITVRRKGTILRKITGTDRLVRYQRKWTGQDLADFISISVYTGLRISDVVTFHADRMQPTGEILLRTTKSGTHVYTWVPTWLQERIKERAITIGPRIFGEYQTTDITS